MNYIFEVSPIEQITIYLLLLSFLLFHMLDKLNLWQYNIELLDTYDKEEDMNEYMEREGI